MKNIVTLQREEGTLTLCFEGELTLRNIPKYEKQLQNIATNNLHQVTFELNKLTYIDTAAAIFLHNLKENFSNVSVIVACKNRQLLTTIEMVEASLKNYSEEQMQKEPSVVEKIGKVFYNYWDGFIAFLEFFGELFTSNLRFITSLKNIRYKEIAFEINESAVKALGIVALTSFLIGLVIAYQSAYQLKIYGANIYIVDMMGISIFRELAPVITAIVIAGRSGSAFTAQIGSMKITQELDAMRTMGFEPFAFLVLPRIIALVITMPILIFLSDIMGIFGGMLVASVDLSISPELFIDRLSQVVAAKHFFVGIFKGPFFAFLIATIGIYRGLIVKDDTQSIGFNTTKSVVESIFAVIVCDAVFSIIFTNLGI